MKNLPFLIFNNITTNVLCYFENINRAEVDEHTLEHTLECDVCGQKYSDSVNLFNHKQKEHNSGKKKEEAQLNVQNA